MSEAVERYSENLPKSCEENKGNEDVLVDYVEPVKVTPEATAKETPKEVGCEGSETKDLEEPETCCRDVPSEKPIQTKPSDVTTEEIPAENTSTVVCESHEDVEVKETSDDESKPNASEKKETVDTPLASSTVEKSPVSEEQQEEKIAKPTVSGDDTLEGTKKEGSKNENVLDDLTEVPLDGKKTTESAQSQIVSNDDEKSANTNTGMTSSVSHEMPEEDKAETLSVPNSGDACSAKDDLSKIKEPEEQPANSCEGRNELVTGAAEKSSKKIDQPVGSYEHGNTTKKKIVEQPEALISAKSTVNAGLPKTTEKAQPVQASGVRKASVKGVPSKRKKAKDKPVPASEGVFSAFRNFFRGILN